MLQNELLTRRTILRSVFSAPLLAAVPAFAGSKEFWEAKASTDWNADEIDRMLTKSPWAKEASVSFNGGPGGYGGNRGGGGGGGRRSGGIGFPGGGGGIGFPGGGGGGYPGGGRTGGGGYPSGGGYPRGDDGRQNYRATVRWESALPIQQALHLHPEDGKPDPEFAKYYVIQVLGDLPDFGARRRRKSDNDDDSSPPRRSDTNRRDDEDEDAQNERRLEMFKQYTKIELHDRSLRLEKVEQGSRTSSRGPGTLFYFSRMDDLSLDDKQLTFITKMGPVEIKAKFVPKEMVYHGKLAV